VLATVMTNSAGETGIWSSNVLVLNAEADVAHFG